MKRALSLLLVLSAVTAGAQSQPASPLAAGPANSVASKRPPPPKIVRSSKTGIPDPDLLDGSKLEPEKRPLHGMLSEIEMGEQEGGNTGKISPNSGPAGGSSQQAPDKNGGAAKAAAGGAASEKIAEGPAAEAQGAQATDLKVPEGAQAAGAGQEAAKPRQLKIGDASLQIQTINSNPAGVVGSEPSAAQQYEKKTPAGSQSNSRNQGAEKGRVIPKGL